VSRESRRCVPTVATRTPPRTALPPPLHCIGAARAWGTQSAITCALRVSVQSYVTPKGPLQCKRCQRFGHTQRNCGYAPRCVACEGSHHSGGCSTPREQPQCCGCGSYDTANYRDCIKWKEVKAALAKQAPKYVRKSAAKDHTAAPKAQPAGPSAEQMDVGEGWNHVVRGGRFFKATTTPPQIQIPFFSRSRMSLSSLTWPPPGRRPDIRSLSPSLQQPLSRLLGRPRRKQPRVSKSRQPNPQHPIWWSPPEVPPPQSRKFLISMAFPSKHAWSWLVGSSRQSPPARGLSWRPLFCSRPNIAARPRRTERCKPLRLACWNADGVRDRKLELEHFLSQHVVHIFLLSEAFFKRGQAFRLANYVCHRADRQRGQNSHHGPPWYSPPLVPVPGPTHLEGTGIQVILAGRPVKILAAYLSPSHPLIGVDLTACFGGGLQVLLAGDLNAKHVDLN